MMLLDPIRPLMTDEYLLKNEIVVPHFNAWRSNAGRTDIIPQRLTYSFSFCVHALPIAHIVKRGCQNNHIV